FHITITIGFSNPITSYSELVESYNKSLAATKLRFRKGRNCLIHYRETKGQQKNGFQMPEDRMKHLVSMLKLGHLDSVETDLREILHMVCDHSYEDFQLTIQVLIYKVRIAIHEMTQYRMPQLIGFDRLSENTNWAETVDDVKEIMMAAFGELLNHMTDRRNSKHQNTLNMLLEIINERLADSTLCPDLIAEQANLSTSYVRKFFKNMMGVSISDYIISKRIEFCKERLAKTEIPVKEICIMVGFGSYNYFFTVFKKQTGRTPMRFRKDSRLKPDSDR
ncbi:MAG: AraC family transcriptional regulator, partial [Spirochaetaceae bacterium]|nr:AraC family transcriptional regulator [Spirochaetaceae bacterium]